MQICIDGQTFNGKPQKSDIRKISNRIAYNSGDLAIQVLAKHVVQPYSRTWLPAVFSKDAKGEVRRKNEFWFSQTLFALDFDEGASFEEVLSRCQKYNVMPAFVYSTFSSVNNNKFRVVFQNSFEVRDIRIRNVIQLALMALFIESDRACKDASRMFFGGKELIYNNYEATIDVAHLVFSMCEFFSNTSKSNSQKRIKRFCERTGINIINGFPYVETVHKENFKNGRNDEHSYIYYRFGSTFVQNKDLENEVVIIHFNQKATQEKAKSFQNGIFEKINIDIDIDQESSNMVTHFDFNKLEKLCNLYSQILSNKYWASHNELFGIATNLVKISGGMARFLDLIKNKVYEYDLEKWNFTTSYIKRMNYYPQRCENFCAFSNECHHARNIIETVKTKRGKIGIFEVKPQITLDEAERLLAEAFNVALDSDEKKVFVIKGATGLGKTALYESLSNVTIAVPRHNLKKEVSNRMKAIGNSHVVIPEMPENFEGRGSVLECYKRGDYKGAKNLQEKIAKEDNQVSLYLKALEEVKNSSCTLITTHDRVCYEEYKNETVIIDEDIFPVLFKIDSASIQAIENLGGFPHVVDELKNTEQGRVSSFDDLNSLLQKKILNSERKGFFEKLEQKGEISNIFGLFNCKFWVKTDADRVLYVSSVSDFLLNNKVIILSATANEMIYIKLFGDRLEFFDISHVKNKGKIIQYPHYSFSRTALQSENKHKLFAIAKKLVKNQLIITYKRYSEEFENCVATFSNLTGLDSFSGKSLAIIGTPHIDSNVYLLYAKALGGELESEDSVMKYVPIKRNGMEYYFETFPNNPFLQEIQQHLIESELVQAIGRARILRNDCTVTVLSNFPIEGAEFRDLPSYEPEQQK